MSLFYSASAGGFLDDAIHSTIPADARPVTAEAHKALIAAACSGSVITADANGYPQAVAAPPPEDAELLRQIRSQRDKLLRECDFTQMPDYPITAALRGEWRSYRQALRDLPEIATDLASVAWPAPPSV